jgi:hypothetical protein
MSYRQEEAAREILSLHPCSARCGARYRCELCGSGRCRARSSWRALFTALRTALSSPSGSLGRSAPNFPDGRRAAGGRVFSRPSGSFRHAPLPQHRRPRRPQTPDLSRPLTIPRRQLPLPLAANYRQFLTTIDRGDSYLRTLLIHGARAVIRVAERKAQHAGSWLAGLMGRRNKNVAAVALANKNVRIVWALLAHDRDYEADFGLVV